MTDNRLVGTLERVGALERVRREIERNALRAKNGIRMSIRSRPGVGLSPKDVVWRSGRAELWHYRNDQVGYRPPLLIVFSIVSRSYILDLTGNSFIEQLLKAGFDVYLLDWGVADERDASNTLEDYVDRVIPAAIDRVRGRSRTEKINVLGYCFGGVLTLLHCAHHPDSPIRSLTVMATPVDFTQMGPLGDVLGTTDLEVDAVLDENGNVPPGVILQGFKSLTPTGEITGYVNLLERMWSDEYVAAYQAMTGWANDHVPLPGALAKQVVRMLLRGNGFMTNDVVLDGDRISLADVQVPFLSVMGKRDHIVPEACSAPVMQLIGSQDKHELQLSGGHIGLVVGKTAARTTIPTVIDFLRQRSEPI